jgi:hypothetical protein
MATIRNLTQSPGETSKEFNRRLMRACFHSPVTDYQAAVVDGMPTLTLLSEIVDADEEMVQEAKQDGSEIQLGDQVPSDVPLLVQVIKTGAVRELGDVEQGVSVMNERAKGEILEIEHVEGPDFAWVTDENDSASKKKVMVQTSAVYLIVSSVLPLDAPPESASKR